MAEELLRQRVNELVRRRRDRVLLGIEPDADLTEYAIYHLRVIQDLDEYSHAWLTVTEAHLARAVEFFTRYQYATQENREPEPRSRNLAAIGVRDTSAYVRWLKCLPNGRGSTLGSQAVRHHLSALSKLFKRAISEGKLPMGQNPVAAMLDKPKIPPSTTQLLEVPELALLIESARTLPMRCGAGARKPLECAYPLIATLALTGIRDGEARRLKIQDLDFEARCIEVRGTKTRGSVRTVPMHPQLEDILKTHVNKLGRTSGPVFPGRKGGVIGQWTGTLDMVASRSGHARGEIRTRRFRVSYATHRSTCDGVDANTVRLELGHGSLAMMERVYTRAQRRSSRMGIEMAFRTECLGSEHHGILAKLRGGWTPGTEGQDQRIDLVHRFLTAIHGMSAPQVEAVTGVPDATVNRLRAGQCAVREINQVRMRAYLTHGCEKVGVTEAPDHTA
ncbi:MAG: tyrosine-type recombinase/integrase [Longimicrobiaceae bacterium]